MYINVVITGMCVLWSYLNCFCILLIISIWQNLGALSPPTNGEIWVPPKSPPPPTNVFWMVLKTNKKTYANGRGLILSMISAVILEKICRQCRQCCHDCDVIMRRLISDMPPTNMLNSSNVQTQQPNEGGAPPPQMSSVNTVDSSNIYGLLKLVIK